MAKKYVNFNWHIEGGGKLSPSPFANLVASLYAQAVYEMRSLRASSWGFEDAAKFLLKDPYGILTKEAKELLETEIWERRDEERAARERDFLNIERGFYNDR